MIQGSWERLQVIVTATDVHPMRVVARTLAVGAVGVLLGVAGGRIVASAVDVSLPRPLFHRAIGNLVLDGRMTRDLPAARRSCAGSEWFDVLVTTPDDLSWSVSDRGNRVLRYADEAGVAVVDQPTYVGDLGSRHSVYLVHVTVSDAIVRGTFQDGSRDEMRAVEGWAVLVDDVAIDGKAERGRVEVAAKGRTIASIELPSTPDAAATERCLVQR